MFLVCISVMKYDSAYTLNTRILAERKTHNMNAEIVGSAYTRITIITLLHLSKITILTLFLRGRLTCEAANMRVYTVITWHQV